MANKCYIVVKVAAQFNRGDIEHDEAMEFRNNLGDSLLMKLFDDAFSIIKEWDIDVDEAVMVLKYSHRYIGTKWDYDQAWSDDNGNNVCDFSNKDTNHSTLHPSQQRDHVLVQLDSSMNSFFKKLKSRKASRYTVSVNK